MQKSNALILIFIFLAGCSTLDSRLSSNNLETRKTALLELRVAPSTKKAEIIRKLKASIADADTSRASRAADALVESVEDGSDAGGGVSAIASALKDSNRQIRELAAASLAKLGARSRDVTPELKNALGDDSLLVRENVAAALKAINEESKRNALNAMLADEKNIDDLIVRLNNENIKIKLDAIRMLGEFGQKAERAVPALTVCWKNSTVEVKTAYWLNEYERVGDAVTSTLRKIGPTGLTAIEAVRKEWAGLNSEGIAWTQQYQSRALGYSFVAPGKNSLASTVLDIKISGIVDLKPASVQSENLPWVYIVNFNYILKDDWKQIAATEKGIQQSQLPDLKDGILCSFRVDTKERHVFSNYKTDQVHPDEMAMELVIDKAHDRY